MASITKINYILIILGAICLRAFSANPIEPRDKPETSVSAFQRILLTKYYAGKNMIVVKNVDFGKIRESHLLVSIEVTNWQASDKAQISLIFDDPNKKPLFSSPLTKLAANDKNKNQLKELRLTELISRQDGIHDVYLTIEPHTTPIDIVSLQFEPNDVFIPDEKMWYYMVSQHSGRSWFADSNRLSQYHLRSRTDYLYRFSKVWESQSFYSIQSLYYAKLPEAGSYLELENGTFSETAPLIQAKLSREPKQNWLVEGIGSYYVRIRSHLSLENCIGTKIGSEKDSDEINVHACSKSDSQIWSIIPGNMTFI